MSIVVGIDPGATGALALYDTDTKRIIAMHDMPVWYQVVSNKKRKRLDPIAIADLFDTFELMGAELIVMEAVGGRPRQSATHAFTFGYGVGMLYMAAIYSRIIIETVPPGHWKKVMNVPGKTKADDTAIMYRADEMFPEDREMFRGVNGGKKIDRAEAAMMAKFGAEYILHTMRAITDKDAHQRKAKTGA